MLDISKEAGLSDEDQPVHENVLVMILRGSLFGRSETQGRQTSENVREFEARSELMFPQEFGCFHQGIAGHLNIGNRKRLEIQKGGYINSSVFKNSNKGT